MRTVIFLFGLCLVAVQGAGAQDRGEATYKATCMRCHGPSGDGKGHEGMKVTPADLRSDAVQDKSDQELYDSIALGAGHKEYPHAFAERGLTRKQITDVITYIRGFAKKSTKAK